MHAVSGILAALFDRERTGHGAVLEVAMFDVVADWMSFALQYTRHTGIEREPNGMSTPMVAPYGAYPTADGQTVLLGTTNDAEWQRLTRDLIGRPDLAADPRLAGNEARCTHRAEIDAAITRWTVARDLALIQDLADAAGIGNSRYNTVSEVLAHPQLTERGRWQPVGSPAGPVEVILPPVVSPGWAARLDPVPALGQHTGPILADLGYSAGEIERLEAASSARTSSHIDRSLS